jgi:hypothetical protein
MAICGNLARIFSLFWYAIPRKIWQPWIFSVSGFTTLPLSRSGSIYSAQFPHLK